MISGATGSGKPTFVYWHLPQMYADNPPVETLSCYGIHQPLFDEIEETLHNFTLHRGLPTPDELDQYTQDKQHRLIILDDLMMQVVKNDQVELLFTQGCYHRNVL